MDQRKALRSGELERRLKDPSTGVSDFESIAPEFQLMGILRRAQWVSWVIKQQLIYSALENEISLNRVMVLKIDVLRQRRIIHLEFGRLGYIRW